MNPARNEVVVKLAGQDILLRPTFENLASIEAELGGLPYLAQKFGAGVDLAKPNALELAKSLPGITEAVKIIHLAQAEKKFSRDEIFEMTMKGNSLVASRAALHFVMICVTGNKLAEEPTPEEKKS